MGVRPVSERGVRAIMFDVGDTLVRLGPMERDLAPSLGSVLDAAGIECEDGAEAVCDRLLNEMRRAILSGFERGELEEHLLPEMARSLLASAGIEVPASVADDLAGVLHEADIARIEPWPGAVEQLLALREQGYRLAAVSNTTTRSQLLQAFFERLNLAPCFDAWVFSIDLGVRKPHPRIYQHALDAIRASGDEALFVGDRVREDVIGPRSAGIAHAVLTHEHRQEDPGDSTPCAVITRLADLGQVISSLR